MKATIVRRTPVQDRSTGTVQAILEAASQLLAESNSEDLTTTKIAVQAGVSVGALYRFFPDKQSIIDAIAVERMEEFRRVLEGCFAGNAAQDGPAFLGRVIDAYIEFLDGHPDFRGIALRRQVSASTRERHVGSEVGPAALVKRFMLEPLGIELSPEIELKLRVASETGDRLIAYAYEQGTQEGRREIVEELKVMLSRYLFG